MSIKGIVKDGVIVLEPGSRIPDGTPVEIVVPADLPLSDEVMKFSGSLKGNYPRDFARNHDHYIHGTPKK